MQKMLQAEQGTNLSILGPQRYQILVAVLLMIHTHIIHVVNAWCTTTTTTLPCTTLQNFRLDQRHYDISSNNNKKKKKFVQSSQLSATSTSSDTSTK